MSKVLMVWPMIESEKIFTEDQHVYPLGVGMLLYVVKHLEPHIANTTRELSKVNNCANSAAFKELLCVIKNALDTRSLGLGIGPTGNANKP